MSQVPQITALPPAPRRSDAPEDFSAKADALAAAQPGFVSQANELATFTNQRAVSAEQAAQAAAVSKHAVEVGKAEVAANTEAVASNKATVATLAGEVAENAQQVATNTQQVATDAHAVAAALASIADGPVHSVNGKTGAVTLDAAAVGAEPALTPATEAEMGEGAEAELRSMSPKSVRKAILAAAEPLSEALTPLMPSDHQPGDVIEAVNRDEPKWIALGKSYLRATYPETAARNVDRAPMESGGVDIVLGSTSTMPSSVFGADEVRGVLVAVDPGGTRADRIVTVDRDTGAHTVQTMPRSSGGLQNSVAAFTPSGDVWVISWAGTGAIVRVYQRNASGVFSEYAYQSLVLGVQVSADSRMIAALSKDTLLYTSSVSTYQKGIALRVASPTAISVSTTDSPLDQYVSAPEIVAQTLMSVSLSPDGQYLIADNYSQDNGSRTGTRVYRRSGVSDSFEALPPLPSVPGMSWGGL